MWKNIGITFMSGLKECSKKNFAKNIHISCALNNTDHFLSYNDKIYPPLGPDDPPRGAYVCHTTENFKYSYKRMWYIASFLRGKSIDEALKQLEFIRKKGAIIARKTLLEAQEKAVKEHNVEFKSNLWVSESFVGKGLVIKGMRRHARGSMGQVRYGYVHYFVTLEEGSPPEHYYPHRRELTGEEWLEKYITKYRSKKVNNSL